MPGYMGQQVWSTVLSHKKKKMQSAVKKYHSVIYNIIIVSDIMPENKKYEKSTYMLFAEVDKRFGKLWFKRLHC